MPAREDEERGRGIPRSEEERAARHEELYPGTPLPPRGTGLSGEGPSGGQIAAIAGLAVFGLLVIAIAAKRR